MRKILFLSIVLALAASLVGLGVQAQLVDTELAVNKVQAGKLNLKVNGEDGVPVVITFKCFKPGQCERKEYQLTNDGCVDGYLNITSIKVKNYENGRTEPELEAGDPSDGDPGPGLGELQNQLKVAMKFDGDPICWWDNGDRYMGWDYAKNYDGRWLKWNQPLKAGCDTDFIIEELFWPNDGDALDSQCMTDSVEIEITIKLSQNPL